jgi:hypothetical protein
VELAEALMSARPDGVCGNCWAVWRAAKPRPPGVYCWHLQTAATLAATGWRVLDDVDRDSAAALRALARL